MNPLPLTLPLCVLFSIYWTASGLYINDAHFILGCVLFGLLAAGTPAPRGDR